MFKTSMTPRTITRPTPARPAPAAVYTQRATEFARIIGGAR